MQTINQIQDEIIEDVSVFDDNNDKLEYLIDLGKSLPKLGEEYKTPEYEIHGCQSKVWLRAYSKNNLLFFEGDSNGIIPKGIISLLVKILSGHSAKEIAECDLYFIEKTGLQQFLSMNRSNGLPNMVKKMKFYGIAFQAAN